MNPDIQAYNQGQDSPHREVCHQLAELIDEHLPEATSKIWHGHPVWFLEGNPTVGYSKQKPGIRLMFWSGADFEERALNVVGKKFKDASVFFNHQSEIDTDAVQRWLGKSKEIQWDYQNLVKRRGNLTKRGAEGT